MVDEGNAIEQGITVEQQPRQMVAVEAPPQEPVTPQRQQVNLDNFYKDEVARHKIEQTLPGQKAWEQIEEAAQIINAHASQVL